MFLTDRTGSFAGGSGSGSTDFNYDFELTNVWVKGSATVASETGSLWVDSGKGQSWDVEIDTNSFSSSDEWTFIPTHRVIVSSGDELALGVSGSAPAVWYYAIKGEYIR